MKADQIARFLPEFWREAAQEGTPIAALLDVMAGMIDPVERQIAGIGAALDPNHCPARMLPLLARMLGLDALLPFARGSSAQLNERAFRDILSDAPALLDRRGTPEALLHALKVATGRDFTLDESPDAERPFHIAVHCARGSEASGGLIEAVIRLMKPAHITHELIWPADD
ncbi:MAG: phage tail protein [Pseudomonadota bacterium]